MTSGYTQTPTRVATSSNVNAELRREPLKEVRLLALLVDQLRCLLPTWPAGRYAWVNSGSFAGVHPVAAVHPL